MRVNSVFFSAARIQSVLIYSEPTFRGSTVHLVMLYLYTRRMFVIEAASRANMQNFKGQKS